MNPDDIYSIDPLLIQLSQYVSQKFVLQELLGTLDFCIVSSHSAYGKSLSECQESECIVKMIHNS